MHASLGGGLSRKNPLPTLPLTDSLAQIGDLKSWVDSLFTGVLRPSLPPTPAHFPGRELATGLAPEILQLWIPQYRSLRD